MLNIMILKGGSGCSRQRGFWEGNSKGRKVIYGVCYPNRRGNENMGLSFTSNRDVQESTVNGKNS